MKRVKRDQCWTCPGSCSVGHSMAKQNSAFLLNKFSCYSTSLFHSISKHSLITKHDPGPSEPSLFWPPCAWVIAPPPLLPSPAPPDLPAPPNKNLLGQSRLVWDIFCQGPRSLSDWQELKWSTNHQSITISSKPINCHIISCEILPFVSTWVCLSSVVSTFICHVLRTRWR